MTCAYAETAQHKCPRYSARKALYTGSIPVAASLNTQLRAVKSLRIKNADGAFTQRTPAMAAGIATYQRSLTQLAGLLD